MINKLVLGVALLGTFSYAQAQFSNAKTESVSINGNCAMCKRTIEKAGSVKGEAVVSWDATKRVANVTYNTAATSLDAVLKRVAYAGYDNDRYLAPAEAYAALHSCCKYDRAPQAGAVEVESAAKSEHSADAGQPEASINGVLTVYFALKDALVAGEADGVPSQAIALSNQLRSLKMPQANNVATLADGLAKEKSLNAQRAGFAALSESLYKLVQKIPPATAIYYQHCPMYTAGKKKGANWLSAEKAIRNPYYGDSMLTCGSVIETLPAKGNNTQNHQHN